MRFRPMHLALAATALSALAGSGCATAPNIPGTNVGDTRENRAILEVCEKYRHALEDRDAETLLSLASPQYFEDSGTPKAEDDYGYEGLKQIINTRLAALKAVRYNIQYRKVAFSPGGTRAAVDIRYDASFQLLTEIGDRWERKQSEKRLELEFDKNKRQWLFTTGM
jgi:hypothetical protein